MPLYDRYMAPDEAVEPTVAPSATQNVWAWHRPDLAPLYVKSRFERRAEVPGRPALRVVLGSGVRRR
jgi:hypothetical protein